jgi:hypothetical protein
MGKWWKKMGNLFRGLINRTTGWILNILGVVFLYILDEPVMSFFCFIWALFIFMILVFEIFVPNKEDKE